MSLSFPLKSQSSLLNTRLVSTSLIEMIAMKYNIRTVSILGWVLMQLFAAAPVSAGKLDDVREEVSDKSDNSSSSSSESSSSSGDSSHSSGDHSYDDSDGEDILVAFFAEIIVYTLLSPLWLPFEALEDRWECRRRLCPTPYYSDECTGHMQSFRTCFNQTPQRREEIEEKIINQDGRNFALTFRTQVARDFDGLWNMNAAFDLQLSYRLALDVEVHYLFEELANYKTDHMLVGDTNILFRFAENENYRFAIGLGARGLQNDPGEKVESGLNFVYDFRAYPIKPWTGAVRLEAGWLGEAGVVESRLSLGAMLGPVALEAGYWYMKIGSVPLKGPFLSVLSHF